MRSNDGRPRAARRGVQWLLLVLVVGGAGLAWRPIEARRLQADGSEARSGQVRAAFSADVTISHRRVRADGSPVGVESAPVQLHLDHRPVAGQWRTTLTLREVPTTAVETPSGPRQLRNPFAITRMEFDGNGRMTRLFDAGGREVAPPGPDDRRRVSVPGQPPASLSVPAAVTGAAGSAGLMSHGAGMLVAAEAASARRSTLIERLGPPVGRVRGLDRFVSVAGETTREVLLHPGSALPVEVTVTRNGRREHHVTADYEPFGTRRYLRRHLRAERAVPDGSGERLVTVVSLANVAVDDGVRP